MQQEVRAIAGDPVTAPTRIEAEQLGVVVEHLLEVRHHPSGVDGVAGKPTA
jgi:hypothetical protein